MNAKLAWFQRRFSFSFPVEMHADLVERLRGTPARVEEKVRSMSPELLTRRIGDTWSIQENVGHLLDLEPLWFGRVEDIFAGADTMREADLTNTKTHEANHNSTGIDVLTASFRRVRLELIHRLDGLGDSDFVGSAKHPRLEQPMRLVDLCLFVADHDDYHLARMTALVSL